MNVAKFKTESFKLVVCATAALLVSLGNLHAQKTSRVMNLRVNNQPAGSANVDVFPPKGSGNPVKTLSKGMQVESGTKLIIPPKTAVQFESPGGTQNVFADKDNKIEYTVVFTEKGENHILSGEGASIINKVNPGKFVGYDYRNSNGKGTTCASKATEFSFTDLSDGKNEKAVIKTTEGAVHITDQRPVTVNGKPLKGKKEGEAGSKSVSVTQSAGSQEFVSSNVPVNYQSFEEAIAAISAELMNENEDDKADDLVCLGDLYMDAGQPAKAIAPFREAYEFYNSEYGEDEVETLNAQLSLAHAYVEAGNKQKGAELARNAIKILEEDMEGIKEDMQFVHGDEEVVALLCDDYVELAALCGWAYELLDEEEESAKFYKLAEQDCD